MRRFLTSASFLVIPLILICLHRTGYIPQGFWITDSFEIEIIGSGVLAFVIFLITSSLSKSSEYQRQKEEVMKYFSEVILVDIKEQFLREPGINVSYGINKLMYFDNSPINPLFDSISYHRHDIYKFLGFWPDTMLAKNLLDFYRETNEAYRHGEKMDALMMQMGKRKKKGTLDVSREMTFIKAITFCGYNVDTVCDLLNEPQYTIQNFTPGEENLIVRFYSGDLTGIDKDLKSNYINQKKDLIEKRQNLLSKAEEIKKVALLESK